MTATTKNTVQQSIEEIFVELENQIYYPGYTENCDAITKERIEWEFREFAAQFSTKK